MKDTVLLFFILSVAALAAPNGYAQQVTGELKRWHPVTLTFEGPATSETSEPNPFRDFRLNVTFRHEGSGNAYIVPGYFAADGDAADTGASAGSKWRVHFTPSKTGVWTYVASFRRGNDVALSLSPTAGEGTAFNGERGTFTIAETDKSGRDFRGKGMLHYVGERYLQFDNGEWFLKGGADSPETLLAYEDFDGTYDHSDGTSIKSYEAHVQDWHEGDPAWRGNKGRGLIGALNYLASEGMNAFSFLTMNVDGDGQNVWPWISPMERDRYDVSKLAQWDIVFRHADRLGLFLHFKTQETENDRLLDGGDLGPYRKLYYRELVARFGYHHALNWNLGEENDIWDELDDRDQKRIKAYAEYIHALDPYDHPVVIHTYPNQRNEVYSPLLGFGHFEGASIQLSEMSHSEANNAVSTWVRKSQAAGRPWIVSVDEPGTASLGVSTDDVDDNYNQDDARKVLWAILVAGGAGVEWYFGYSEPQNDLNAEDWHSRDAMWDYTRYALTFFREHLPFTEMEAKNNLLAGAEGYVLAKEGAVYVLYLPEGGRTKLDLPDGTYTVRWYNPRQGGNLLSGSVQTVEGAGTVVLGVPPRQAGEDWVVLVRHVGDDLVH